MAKTTITHITDDIDGSQGAEELSFAFDGVDYTIDLTKKNRAAFEKAIKPYVDAATKVGRGRQRRKTATSTASVDNGKVREWARNNGIEVSERGRIPSSVIDQYRAAN